MIRFFQELLSHFVGARGSGKSSPFQKAEEEISAKKATVQKA
jgi:hypothetical protein